MLEQLSPKQTFVLDVPETCNIALLGARGGGKTMSALALCIRHMDEYEDSASILFVRRTLRSMSDFEEELRHLAMYLWSDNHSYNKQEKIMRLGSGAKITLAALESSDDYAKLQGKNFSMIIIDEVTQYPNERLLRLLRSNLRAPEGVPTRVVICGNPGGPLHGRIFANHIKDREDSIPYVLEETGEEWVTLQSGPADNPFIDLQAYIRRLREACHGNPILLQQWLFGDWTRGEGLMWPMFDPTLHVLKIDHEDVTGNDLFVPCIGVDWGLSSPSVGHIGVRCTRDFQMGDKFVPRDSVFILDEVTDLIGTPGVDENLNKSHEWTPARLGERVSLQASNWGMKRPNVVIDNARGLQGDDLITMFQQSGSFWNVTGPHKGRRAERWVVVGSMLQAAADKDRSMPHLYVTDRCGFLIYALSNAVRDEKVPDDVADTPHCPDHPLDAATYLINQFRPRRATSGTAVITH